MIAIKAQPSTSSGLPASRQYSLADALNMMLNDSPLKISLLLIVTLVKKSMLGLSRQSTQVMH